MENKKYTYKIENGKRIGIIETPYGTITTPNFFPVTTFGDKYPLDKLVQPYLKRLSECLMVSYHYAKQMTVRPNMPMFIDSGGFASLFHGSEIIEDKGFSKIRTKEGEEIHPLQVLEFQERHANIAATLDFIIPPGLDITKAKRLQKLTIENAYYALENKRSQDILLYASLQCWDEESARLCAKEYASAGFDGISIGGLVPRIKNKELIYSIINAVREEAPFLPIHAFGLGIPDMLVKLWELGLDSTDSSSYVRNAVGNETHAPLFLFPSNSNSGPLTQINNALTNLWTITEDKRKMYLNASRK